MFSAVWIMKKMCIRDSIYNIQDFNPEQVLAVGYTKSKFITDAMMWFDKFSCKRSDLVITVGRDLVETVENRFKGKKVDVYKRQSCRYAPAPKKAFGPSARRSFPRRS